MSGVILSVLLILLGGIRDTLPFFAAAALHEAGHVLACLLLRVPLRHFRVTAAGAVLGYDPASLSYPAEAVIALAGPLAGFLGTAAVAVWGYSRTAAIFGTACLALSVFNLLPILPLDGGVILSALLHWRIGADRSARILSVITHIGVIVLWMCAVAVQLRCGGNLSLLVISVYLLIRLAGSQV